MIQQQLRAMQGVNPAQDYANVAKMTQYGSALHMLPELSKLASIKSQDRQLQEKYLSNVAGQLKDYAALTPEQQAAQGPLYHQLISAHSQLAGLQTTPEDISHTLSTPDLARQYASVLNDPLIPADQAVMRLGSVKPGKDREDALGQIQTEAQGKGLALIQQYLPMAVAQYGGTQQNPLPMASFIKQLQADPQLGPVLAGSPTLQKTLPGYLSDEKNSATLAGWGLKPGAVNLTFQTEQAKQLATGPVLGQPVKDVLAESPGPDGRPLTPATAAMLPNGPQLIAQATQIANARDIKTAAAKSYADAQAIAASKGDTPMAFSMPNTHIVSKETGQPVSQTLTFNQGQTLVGGPDKVVAMDTKAYQNYVEITSLMKDMGRLTEIAANMKGAGLPQVVGAWLQDKTGTPGNEVQAMEAYQSLIIRYQKALTGTGRYVQSEAVKMAGGFPSFWDSSASGLNRIKETAAMLTGQRDAALGKIDFGDLQGQVAQAQQRINDAQSADVAKQAGNRAIVDFPDGSYITVPKGTKLPPGGKWR